MTRISLLEDQKAIFTAQKEELENKRGDIYVREQQAMSEVLTPFFSDFTPEVEIEVQRGSVYFKMAHPEVSYKKELFNIYLRENWRFDGEENKKSFDGVDLSYYTTSTKGVDSWELKRLQLLGVVAEIVLNHQERILLRVNNVVLPFKEEYDRVYNQMNLIGQAIRELDIKITAVKKERIEFDLKNEGVTFDVGVNIQLKHNYTPYIKFIKLINISKSGKTATASIIWARSEHEVQEDNVRINDVVTQVLGFRNTIIKKELVD
jgi:hypothetical protein